MSEHNRAYTFFICKLTTIKSISLAFAFDHMVPWNEYSRIWQNSVYPSWQKILNSQTSLFLELFNGVIPIFLLTYILLYFLSKVYRQLSSSFGCNRKVTQCKQFPTKSQFNIIKTISDNWYWVPIRTQAKNVNTYIGS